jgi:hypothetical protein
VIFWIFAFKNHNRQRTWFKRFVIVSIARHSFHSRSSILSPSKGYQRTDSGSWSAHAPRSAFLIQVTRVHPPRVGRLSNRRGFASGLDAVENPKSVWQRGIASAIKNPDLVRRWFPIKIGPLHQLFDKILILILILAHRRWTDLFRKDFKSVFCDAETHQLSMLLEWKIHTFGIVGYFFIYWMDQNGSQWITIVVTGLGLIFQPQSFLCVAESFHCNFEAVLYRHRPIWIPNPPFSCHNRTFCHCYQKYQFALQVNMKFEIYQ